VPRRAALVPSDVDEEVAKNLNFHVVLGSYKSPDADTSCSVQGGEEVKFLEQPNRLDSLHVQFEPRTKQSIKPPLSLSVPPSKGRSPSPRLRVRFLGLLGSKSRLESTSSEETLTVVSKKTIVTKPSLFPPTASPPVLSSGLCQVLIAWYKEQGNPAAPCCGYIADPHRIFGLYPQNYYPEPSPTITLRQILGGEHNKFQELDILEKLKVTLAVSTNILHLYKTPWLARILTLDDIVFFQGNQKTAYHSVSPARPSMTGIFVTMPVVAAPSETQLQRKPRKPSKASNLIVLSLGALLIQVMIGRAEPALDMAAVPDIDLKAIMEKREAGFQLRNKVLEEVGENYMMAVEWCLDNVLGIMGLEDEDFCQNFYEGVVLRLEKDVQQLSSCYWE
jgi:hypothetical protein